MLRLMKASRALAKKKSFEAHEQTVICIKFVTCDGKRGTEKGEGEARRA